VGELGVDSRTRMDSVLTIEPVPVAAAAVARAAEVAGLARIVVLKLADP